MGSDQEEHSGSNLKTDDEVPKTTSFQKIRNRKKSYSTYDILKLKKELAHKPDILKYVLFIRSRLKYKSDLLSITKNELKALKKRQRVKTKNAETQTGVNENDESRDSIKIFEASWNLRSDDLEISLADQVKQAAECAITQTGMVYEETSGMYYDYNTGYYYNSEKGLYYHSNTGCYYYYDSEKNEFTFHSHAQPSDFPHANHERKRKKKDKKKRKEREDSVNESDEVKKLKSKVKDDPTSKDSLPKKGSNKDPKTCDIFSNDSDEEIEKTIDDDVKSKECSVSSEVTKNEENDREMSEGECSYTDSSESYSDSSCESIASKYPPCMRIIVNETSAQDIKIGSLFLITKEGGTLGREGSRHSIIIPEENISRHHLTFTYDEVEGSYFVKDVGSRNGTLLNGKNISVSKKEGELNKIPHGSTIVMGNTKLLCHIHKGNATCGHCEPGLLIKEAPPKPVNVAKPVNIKASYQKELRRLKDKYKVQTKDSNQSTLPEGYEDKARIRREKVGSTHSSEKTEQASLDTNIPSANKGFKMLQKMGWSEGDGLGKSTQGIVEPVALVSNEGTSGLGAPSAARPEPTVWKKDAWATTRRRYDRAVTSAIFGEDSDDDDDDPKTDK